MTPDQRFYITILFITLAFGIVGWLLRRVIQTNDEAITANTRATEKLTDAVSDLTQRVARLEGPHLRRPRDM